MTDLSYLTAYKTYFSVQKYLLKSPCVLYVICSFKFRDSRSKILNNFHIPIDIIKKDTKQIKSVIIDNIHYINFITFNISTWFH